MSGRAVRSRVAPGRSAAPAVLLALVGLLVSACGGGGGGGGTPADPTASAPTSAPTGTPGGGEPPAGAPGDALYFYPPQTGATLTYANTGPASSSTSVTVTAVDSGGDGQTVSVTELVTGGSDPVTVERTFVTGPDGGLTIGAEGFAASAPGMEVTATGEDLRFPPISELDAGATATGETFVELTSSGFAMRNDVTYTVAGTGYASVTVPAGTVEAYVVELTLEIDSDVVGSQSGLGRYWFLPGFGLIRQEMTIAGTTLVTELESTSVALT